MAVTIAQKALPQKALIVPAAVLWLVALAFGAVGLFQRLTSGHEAAGYTSYIPWGLWVAAYVYFIGLSAGAFLLSAMVYVFGMQRLERVGKLALFTAIVALLGALLTIWLDIGHMERFWEVYTRGNPRSMMAWMVWLYTAYFLLLLGEFWFAVRADLAEWSHRPGFQGRLAALLSLGRTDTSAEAVTADRRTLRLLGAAGVPLAVAFHGGVGALFGVLGARPFWNAPIFPLMFLVSALASGGALLTFVVAFFWPRRGTAEHRDLVSFLGRLTVGMLAVYLLMEWAEYSITWYADIPSESRPMYEVLGGPYPWVFWVFQVALGAVVPILLFVARPRSVTWVGIAAFLVAATFLATRLNIVIPGLVEPQLEGLDTAYIDARLKYSYFPTLMEWQVLIFIGAFVTALFYLGYKNLPLITQREA